MEFVDLQVENSGPGHTCTYTPVTHWGHCKDMIVLYLEVDLEELVHEGKCTPSLGELKCSSTVKEKNA